VKLVNGKIELTIDKFAEGSFGLIAFNKPPVFNNGNIHSRKEKDLQAFGAKPDSTITTKPGNYQTEAKGCPAGGSPLLLGIIF